MGVDLVGEIVNDPVLVTGQTSTNSYLMNRKYCFNLFCSAHVA